MVFVGCLELSRRNTSEHLRLRQSYFQTSSAKVQWCLFRCIVCGPGLSCEYNTLQLLNIVPSVYELRHVQALQPLEICAGRLRFVAGL